jgi:hypothetical protein
MKKMCMTAAFSRKLTPKGRESDEEIPHADGIHDSFSVIVPGGGGHLGDPGGRVPAGG